MRVAFLCLAHTNETYLRKLVDYCRSDGDTVFVHVDSRSSIARAELRRGGAYVLGRAESLETRWGTFAIVEATLRLMEWAFRGEFDRYVLISGLDLPIKTKRELKERLAERNIFMCVWSELSHERGREDLSWRLVYSRHHYDVPFLNLRGDPFNHWLLDKAWRQCVKGANRIVASIPIPKGWDTNTAYYRGSQWWALNHDSVQRILAVASENWAAYKRRFALMHGPDEVFFHTVLMNTNYAHEIEKVKIYQDAIYGLHDLATFWSVGGAGWLLPSDISRLRVSEAAFSRKVHAVRSREVVRALFGGGSDIDPDSL